MRLGLATLCLFLKKNKFLFFYLINKLDIYLNKTITPMKNTSVAYLEAKGKSKVWAAYADYFAGEDIMEEAFNPNSGYIYIALENGITIGSSFAQDVVYFIYDYESDEEIEFDSYEELEIYLIKQN